MKYKFIFIAILLFASIIRLYSLGTFPPSITWDEAAIGYNAYGLVTNHRDEWLNRTPLSFRSFGDYKSPLGIYLTALPVAVLGLTPLAVRLPVALSGIGIVALGYFLTKELLKQFGSNVNEDLKEKTSFFVMILLAVSPWALHFSMIGFEATIATFLTLLGTFLFLKMREHIVYVVGSGVAFSLSLYAYHSAKVVVPLLVLLLLVVYRKKLRQRIQIPAVFLVVCALASSLIVYATLFKKASDRLYSSTILTNESQQLRPVQEIIPTFVGNMAAHLNPAYLFMGAEDTFRHSNKRDGILSPAEGILLLAGIFVLLRRAELKQLRWVVLPIIISLVPAALGVDVPHANRSLLGLFWWQLVAGIGFLGMVLWLEKQKRHKALTQWFATVLAIIIAVSFAMHLQNDKRVYATADALKDVQYGYKEAIEFARFKESEVEKVFITNKYGQAYIYLLFYKRLTPMEFRGGGLGNYVISDDPWKDGAGLKNVLIIGTDEQIPEQVQSIKDITYPDGSVAFQIVQLEAQ